MDIVLRQEYRAGEKMFVDHAGPTVPVVDPETGEVREAFIFVAVLGASNYTFCEAVWKRDLPARIGSHTRAVEFFKGVAAAVAGQGPDAILGQPDAALFATPIIGRNRLFSPATLVFDGSHLWVGEFKFSERLLRFSVH